MDSVERSIAETNVTPAAYAARAGMMLERAAWAAGAFRRFDRSATARIIEAVATAAQAKAGHFADAVLRETGRGVAKHKRQIHEDLSRSLAEACQGGDLVNPRIDRSAGTIDLPRPVGIVLAMLSETNPVADVIAVTLLAMAGRNAVIAVPAPSARLAAIEAARHLEETASIAGAPDGCIQIALDSSPEFAAELRRSSHVGLIVSFGVHSSPVAAPIIRVEHGNTPVLISGTADPAAAARAIASSLAFDNGLSAGTESVLLVADEIARDFRKELVKAGAHLASDSEVEALRTLLFQDGSLNPGVIGRDAATIAFEAGFRIAAKSKIIIAEVQQVGVGEPLSWPKQAPVAGLVVVRSRSQGSAMARTVLRGAGRPGSAVIHSAEAADVMAFAAATEAARIVVNGPAAPVVSAGDRAPAIDAPMACGELKPSNFVQWSRIVASPGGSPDVAALARLKPERAGPIPEAPADGVPRG